MTASGAASTSVYPTEDDDKHPVCVLVKSFDFKANLF